ncbi:thioredoxin family protein [Microbacterium aquimaris]|uniref:Thioredoxin family protein n=1 Tax=Microbacterium aquimaris TaxID=459816 RepID=A0ABU5N397_9MICO|nr:thioredoxin family protein [Microbacterium aquimaris]MDZ8160550.1 thioredoxin family protein [Microbacterium aquimaris]
MKRGTVVALAIAGVLAVGVGGAVAVSLAGSDDPAAVATESPMGDDSAAEADAADAADAEQEAQAEDDTASDSEPGASPGAYVDYSESALAAAEGTRVLFFHATWCPQCRALDEDIVAEGVPDGVTVLKVDYDTHQDLRQKYDVRQQTTVVALDDSGAAVASFVPYDDPSLDTALAGLGIG